MPVVARLTPYQMPPVPWAATLPGNLWRAIFNDQALRSDSTNDMKYSDEQIFTTLAPFFAHEGTARKEAIAVEPDTDIIAEGLVDSLGIFKLIAFAEEAFKITIEPDEVLLENFQTLRALRNLIVKKLG